MDGCGVDRKHPAHLQIVQGWVSDGNLGVSLEQSCELPPEPRALERYVRAAMRYLLQAQHFVDLQRLHDEKKQAKDTLRGKGGELLPTAISSWLLD